MSALPARAATPARRLDAAWRVPSWSVTVVLAVLWLAVGPATADLAAQVHRVAGFTADGFTIWDNSWFAGHHLPGYSLVFPAVGSALGVRVAGAVAAVLSAALFEAVVGPRSPPAARWWFAVGCLTDLLIGRLTYALGVAIGLAAVLALRRARPRPAVALAVLCAATSPVAGLFLALIGVAVAVAQRRHGPAVMGAAALIVVLVLGGAFPEGGTQPFSPSSFLVTLAISAAAMLVVARHTVLRWLLALYLLAVVVAFVVPSAMGGNVTRFGTAFVAPALLMAAPGARSIRRAALIGVLCAAAAWQWIDPVTQAARGWEDPSASPNYFASLITQIQRAGGRAFRVEVPFTRGHWETVYLARDVALARGWERQLDRRLNPLFYRRRLDPAAYHDWLRANAVRYVALPDVPMDSAGVQEAHLVRSVPSFLQPVWSGAHWRLLRVRDPLPLASGRAVDASLSDAAVSMRVQAAGRVLLRVHWTPYWHLERGTGCLYERHGWTGLIARRAGTFVLTPRFSPGWLFADPPSCPRPPAGGAGS